jgi:carboxypeptidase Q
MRTVLVSLLAVACITTHAQETIDTTMMRRIRTEAFDHSGVADIAHHLTDVAGPRLTNSPGYQRAATWAVTALKQWGIEKAALEPWGQFGKGWSNEQTILAMRKPYYQPLQALPMAWTSGTTNDLKSARVVLLDKLDSATIDAHAADIKGNVVAIKATRTTLPDGFQPFATRFADSTLAKLQDEYMMDRDTLAKYIPMMLAEYRTQLYLGQKGALALLRKSWGRDGTFGVQGSMAYAPGYDAPLPVLSVEAEDFLRLQRLLQDSTAVQVDLSVQNQWYSNDLNGYNVVAEIPGTDPKLKDQVVMLGGHLDSWHASTGATDNAAGCAVMLEAMRILKSLGIKPRRTIRVALWSGEEQGLYGSFGYVKKHFGNPIDMKLKPEQQKLSAYYNVDNGSGKIRGIYTQGNDAVAALFKQWLEPFTDLGATTVTNHSTGGTDHLSFDAVGIPGFQFVQDPLEYETRTHHTNMDNYDHLSIDDLKQAAAIVAAFVYNTAMRTDMVPRKPLPKPGRFLFDFDVPL